MIRFPKKNIAQRSLNKPNPLKPKRIEQLGITEDGPPVDHKELVKANKQALADIKKNVELYEVPNDLEGMGELYPEELWRMHKDLEMLYERHKLSKDQKKELDRRTYRSLTNLEQEADDLLYKFVQNKVKEVGVKPYFELVQKLLNDKSRTQLALRCVIASIGDYKRDTLEVFSNKEMSGARFYLASQKKTSIDPLTGESIPIIDDESDGYERSESESLRDKTHSLVLKLELGPKITKRDHMPDYLREHMGDVLVGLGHEIPTDQNQAWKMLDSISKDSTIEDRIVARIAYLIMNATVHKDDKDLPRLGG